MDGHEKPGPDVNSADPPAHRPSGPLLFVLVVTAVVMTVAVLIVVWMYWLGAVPTY